MDRQQLIVQILEEHFADECDIVGPANLRRLTQGPVEMVRTEHGSNLDLSQVLSELDKVVAFIASSIAIYQAFSARKRPGAAELGKAVEQSAPPRLAPEQREAIIRRLVEWLENDPDALPPPPREDAAKDPPDEEP